MIEIKNGTLERVKSWSDDSIYILADFDRTITVGDSEGSWSILSKSDKVAESYKQVYMFIPPLNHQLVFHIFI